SFLFSINILHPPRPTLFPYTTLFRSNLTDRTDLPNVGTSPAPARRAGRRHVRTAPTFEPAPRILAPSDTRPRWPSCPSKSYRWRSEEHTSELQSRENLVCRLLLEKKK